MPARCRGVLCVLTLLVALAAGACSRPDAPAPLLPEKLTADHVAGAIGGVPHRSTRLGPTAIVPDEFLQVWKPWTGDLDDLRPDK